MVLDYFGPEEGGELLPSRRYVDLVARLAPTIGLMDQPRPLTCQGHLVPLTAWLPFPFEPDVLMATTQRARAWPGPRLAYP